MKPKRRVYAESRVTFRLTYQQMALCQIYGMDPTDLCQKALEDYVAKLVDEFYNIETVCVVHEIRSNPDWEKLAYDCDDYGEMLDRLLKMGIKETRNGIRLKDRKIARNRVNIEIRKRNKPDE